MLRLYKTFFFNSLKYLTFQKKNENHKKLKMFDIFNSFGILENTKLFNKTKVKSYKNH